MPALRRSCELFEARFVISDFRASLLYSYELLSNFVLL